MAISFFRFKSRMGVFMDFYQSLSSIKFLEDNLGDIN